MQDLQGKEGDAGPLLLPGVLLREGDLLDVWGQNHEHKDVQTEYSLKPYY